MTAKRPEAANPGMPWRLGDWHFDPSTGTLSRADKVRHLAPKVADLLMLLVATPQQVVSKETISAALWPDAVVGDEALARCVSKLRKALGDDPKAPAYIQTLAKRGYRLICDVQPWDGPAAAPPAEGSPSSDEAAAEAWDLNGLQIAMAVIMALSLVIIVSQRQGRSSEPRTEAGESRALWDTRVEDGRTAELTERAHDFYFQFTRTDNESAIELYERVIADAPEHAPAQSGLANALVQRVIRWPKGADEPDIEGASLGQALASGRTVTPRAGAHLDRALALAERAVRLAPRDAEAFKALGFVQSAMGRFDDAKVSYHRALELDANAWGALINLGDLAQIEGDHAAAVQFFERAYDAMSKVYDEQAPRVRPWHGALGATIGRSYESLGQPQEAEIWYRRVLSYAPLDGAATVGLARLLRGSGDLAGARRLCRELVQRTGPTEACDDLLEEP